MKYDLAVCYRIYPKISKIPYIYSDNKYKLSEICLCSFKESVKGLNIKLYVLLDSCPEEYFDLFKKYFPEAELISLPGVGNPGTLAKQVEILLNQKESEYVYFAEDDYFYLPEKFKVFLNFFKNNPEIDFLSPYDHLDYYTLDFHKYKSEIKYYADRHWRSASTTCMTFLTRKKILEQSRDVLLSYGKKNFDASMWIALTKISVFNPRYYYFKDLLMFKIYAKAWYFGWKQILFGRKYKLYSPMPSIATHIDNKHLAPVVHWDKFIELLK